MIATGLMDIIRVKYAMEITDVTEHRGYVNTVYGLKTKDGSIVYLRGYNPKDSIMNKKSTNELAILNFVREKTDKVKLDFVISDNENNQKFEYGGLIYTLRQGLSGKPSGHGLVNSAKRRSTGNLLGHLHNTLADFPADQWHEFNYGNYFLPIIFHLSLEELTTLVERANNAIPGTNTLAAKIWGQNRKKAYQYINRYCELRKNIILPVQVIHGDLDPTNVTFMGDRAVGFMDWDFLQKSPRILDLANSMINRPAYRVGDGKITFDFNQVREFIWGYQDTIHNKLSVEEINAVPFAFYNMGLQYLLTAGFLFTKEISDEKLANFLAFRFVFMDKLESLGEKWFKLQDN